MRQFAFAVGGACLAMSGAASGQGLMDIGRRMDEGVRLPFSISISSSAGWDSEPGASSSTGRPNHLPESGSGSAFWQNSANVHYPLGRGRNRFTLDGDYSNTWYFDPPPGVREFENTGNLGAQYFRQFSQRFSVSDSLHFNHQTEPNFAIGASINRPTSGHTYLSNALEADFRWTTRLSAVTSYTVNSLTYDDEAQQNEDHIEHTFSEELRYALTTRTTGSLEYRFSFTDYEENPAAESESHFVLLGVDRPLGRFLSMSLSGGAEFRSYDGPLGNRTAPHFEAALNYHARANTSFRFYYGSGLEDTGSAGVQSSFSRRTGVSVTQRLARGLSFDAGVDYVNSEYTRGGEGIEDRDEETIYVSAGLHYSRHLWRRLYMNANYTFSMVSSDDPLSEYERHRVSLGVSASF